MATVEQQLERVMALRPAVKLALLLGVLCVVGGAYYLLFYDDLANERSQIASDVEMLKEDRRGYERRKKE